MVVQKRQEERKTNHEEVIRNEILEMQERRKYKKWIQLAVELYSQKIKGVFVGPRDNSVFENLPKNIEHIDAKTYTTDA